MNGNNHQIEDKHKKYYIKLKDAFKAAQKGLDQNTKINACIVDVKLIQPLSNPVYLPKCAIVLQVQAKEKCNWLDEEVKLDFAAKAENKWIDTRTVTIPKEQLSFDGNDLKGILGFDLTFEEEEKNVTINYSGNSIAIQYIKYAALQLDTPNNAAKTKENFNPLYAKSEFREELKKAFPSAQFVINDESDWKSMLVPKSIKEDLENTAVIDLPQDLETLNKEELAELNKSIVGRKNQLSELNKMLKKTCQRYKSLEFNYEGEKAAIFDVDYHNNIEDASVAIEAIDGRVKVLEDLLKEVLDAHKKLQDAMMPTSPFVVAAKGLSKKLETFWVEVQEINARFDTYNNLTRTYADWKKELEDTTAQISSLTERSTVMWTDFSAIARTTQKETNKFEALLENYENLKNSISNFEKNEAFKDKKEGLEKAKDGFLEYEAGEDVFSKAEKKEFGLSDEEKKMLKDAGGSYSFEFTEPKLPLYDEKEGIELEDIRQGQVGDCYLLAALANLMGEDSHLIREMIEEKDDLYKVTLYQNGIPVEIEVDKKLMLLKTEETSFSGLQVPNKEIIGANPDDDIWVSIIEKLMSN
jgi:hypothetical protein